MRLSGSVSFGEEIIAAIEGTVEGETNIEPDSSIAAELTERELVVLQPLARGLTNVDTAEKLFLSEGTVRNYISTILDKLNVGDRIQAAALGSRSCSSGND